MVLASEATAKMQVRTEKRKPQVRMVKPGEVTVAARHVAPWLASSLPRAIRNRSPRKLKPGKVNPMPGSPHQEEVVNTVTGKRALGPWSGPFKSHPNGLSDVLPDTIFMDSRGAAHLGLDEEEHQELMRALQEAQESSGTVNNTARAAATANKTTEQIVDVRRAQVKRMREMEAGSLASRQKVPSMRTQRIMQRRDHQINQPRRFYSSNLILKNAQHSKV